MSDRARLDEQSRAFGYALEQETTFHGTKDDTRIDLLISVLCRPESAQGVA